MFLILKKCPSFESVIGGCDPSCNPRTDKYTPRFSAAKEKKFGFSYSYSRPDQFTTPAIHP